MSRPAVTLCYTQTLDGRIATVDGLSQWIGGPESLVLAHRLRAEHDAIMVGAGTVRADDPRLTVRHVAGRDPLRVVVDSRLAISPGAVVLRDGAARGTVVAGLADAPPERRAALEALGARVLGLPAAPGGGVSLPALLAALAGLGVGSVMVEGGSRLITALLAGRLATRAVVCLAPLVLGEGLAGVGELHIRALSRAIRLEGASWTAYGRDMVLDGKVVYPDG